MREILFRGKRSDNGEWIEGYYINIAKVNPFIATGRLTIQRNVFEPEMQTVVPETVGQYTGLTDKNGVKIFEGDIVIGKKGYARNPYYLIRSQRFAVKHEKGFYEGLCDTDYYEFEVIGNIYDNPDLLEVQHENT
ncbi:MAG: YopX family protein [Ruminococcus sp.]|nr:YopX family protein [Ruminococcus sp.]